MEKLYPATKQLIIGITGWVFSLLLVFIVIPQLRSTLESRTKAQKESISDSFVKKNQLDNLIKLSEKIHQGQDTLGRIQRLLPNQPSSQLHLALSGELHKLSKMHNVRLQNIKYSRSTKDVSKNLELESIESEFVVTGIYNDLRVFMRSLETAGLPYAVREARLEESSEGLRLTVNLRAFKKPDNFSRNGN
ncbi:MAG: hypothetical protein ACKN9J_03380 [Holophagaceae bacterium]|jgi:hypothetical protein